MIKMCYRVWQGDINQRQEERQENEGGSQGQRDKPAQGHPIALTVPRRVFRKEITPEQIAHQDAKAVVPKEGALLEGLWREPFLADQRSAGLTKVAFQFFFKNGCCCHSRSC